MEIDELSLGGCFVVRVPRHEDVRGTFAKPFVASRFRERGLRTDFVETYYSSSSEGVIRGMHFQRPPHEHAKLVYCADGVVEDVLLDLRRGSPTYGTSCSLTLDSTAPTGVYIAEGIAHGFLAVRAPALMVYSVTSEYAPAHDTGVRWNSFGFSWPVSSPIVSARDAAFPGLSELDSPF